MVNENPEWSLSVVSHGHDLAPVVAQLLQALPNPERIELILTWNLPGAGSVPPMWPGPLRCIRNPEPRGFGANHNAALIGAKGLHVATIDPDLVFRGDPFPALAASLENPCCGLVAPVVLDEFGAPSDHARSVPTPVDLLSRRLLGTRESADETQQRDVDWIAGLFIAARKSTFEKLGGFDERYYMYCEDVDLGLRCWNASLCVRVVPGALVSHKARRQTLRRSRHFIWHCSSLIRLWRSAAYKTFVSR